MNKPRKTFYICVIGLFLIMMTMVIVSFVIGEPKYQISETYIYIFLIIAVLLIFDSVESLSVGNLVSLNKKVKEKEQEITKLSTENQQLRNQFLSVMKTTFNSKNSNQFFVGVNPSDYVVEKAEEKDIKDDAEIIDNDVSKPSEEQNNSHMNHVNRMRFNRLLSEKLLERFCVQNNIDEENVLKEIKIKSFGNYPDPIIERDMVYDAYIKRPLDEIFIEVLSSSGMSASADFRLYFMISRVYHYSQANQTKAKMILIVPKYSEEYILTRPERFRYNNPQRMNNRIAELYAPAVKNNLLDIVEIGFNEEELKELEKQCIDE